MFNRFTKGLLITILTLAVILGAFLAYSRYFVELQNRGVELCVDLNDLKKLAVLERVPLDKIITEVKKRGVTLVGVFEETLPDASALGELYYAKGVGILAMGIFNPPFCTLENKGVIHLDWTYIYAPSSAVRERVFKQLSWALGTNKVKLIDKEVIEVNEAEEELRGLGLGISEAQIKYFTQNGLKIIPRVWQDQRYNQNTLYPKISALRNYDLIIFDGDEILGAPDNMPALAAAMRANNLKYGYIEIVKQEGDAQLKKLMGRQVVRVHSVPKKELEKLNKETVAKRFVRAAKERGVQLIYLRPFFPPQTIGSPLQYNLDYFSSVQKELTQAGYVLGTFEPTSNFRVNQWQVALLALGVFIGFLFLVNLFIKISNPVIWLCLFALAGFLYLFLSLGYISQAQKLFALLAAITFPSLAVISNLSRKPLPRFSLWDPILIILNILGETTIGIFLLLGLLADYRYMLGVEVFAGVKIALLAPLVIILFYFILQQGEGTLGNRLRTFLEIKVNLALVMGTIFLLAALGILVARSGNFVLPVPGFEKNFRNFLETVMFIRPRTKEFLIGYPALFVAAILALRQQRTWLWLWAAIGAIAPISVFNSFTHVHTPIMVSIARTMNGLTLGIIVGLLVGLIAERFSK